MSRGDIRAWISDQERATASHGRAIRTVHRSILPWIVTSPPPNAKPGSPQVCLSRGGLDMAAALAVVGPDLCWVESGQGPSGQHGIIVADPGAWGDVMLARRDTPTSYHLSVVVDDALQGVSDVVRGRDLFFCYGDPPLLQHILSLPAPRYHHHG